LLAGPLVRFFSGDAYLAATWTLKIEAVMILPVSVANIIGVQVLVGTGRESKYLISNLLGAAIFIAAALVLVPRFAQDGAAFGIVLAETTGAALQAVFARRAFVQALKGSWKYKLAAAALLLAASIWALSHLIPQSVLLLGASVGVGILVYFGALAVMKDELVVSLMDKLLKRRRLPS